jgi:hypothetical protein
LTVVILRNFKLEKFKTHNFEFHLSIKIVFDIKMLFERL